jgi:hypothetical protein
MVVWFRVALRVESLEERIQELDWSYGLAARVKLWKGSWVYIFDVDSTHQG